MCVVQIGFLIFKKLNHSISGKKSDTNWGPTNCTNFFYPITYSIIIVALFTENYPSHIIKYTTGSSNAFAILTGLIIDVNYYSPYSLLYSAGVWNP